MTTTPKISVIVPVYNVASYVGECLSSLVHQTFHDFEIIAVNDGSTDGSLAVLREFESSYPFVRVLDQPNSGVSAAPYGWAFSCPGRICRLCGQRRLCVCPLFGRIVYCYL